MRKGTVSCLWKALAALAASVGVTTGSIVPAAADEPLFGFVYTTDLLPPGKFEGEQWVTLRQGRSQGSFSLLQTRTELSYGATSWLQFSGYVNFAYADAFRNTPSGDTAPPEVFADFTSTATDRFRVTRFESFSLEAIARVLSPYTDGIGLAFYVEPSFGPRTLELENRLILQKNFLNDRLVVAFNATIGYEWRAFPGDTTLDPSDPEFNAFFDRETDVNLGLAASYRFAPGWSAGVELLNEREYAGIIPFTTSSPTNVAYYAGPTLHYGGERFFLTLTALFQLPFAQDWANKGADSFVVRGISNGDDFENFRLRLKAGFYFN